MSTNEPPPGNPGDQPPVQPPVDGGAPPPPPPAPPAGGYGAPPAPPAGGYGAPPSAEKGWEVGDALSYGWAKFQANMQQILIAAVILIVALGVMFAVGFGIMAALTSNVECNYDNNMNYSCDGGTGFIMGMIIYALVIALVFVVAQVIGAGIIRGSLAITEGRAFDYKEILKTDKIGPVLIASLIIAAATFVGIILCYLPGLIVGFATSYTLYFVIDKNMSPVDAIKASVNLVKDNLGPTLIWYIVGGIVASIGLAICLVGGLVSVPVVLIGTAYTYKKLTGQPVAP